MYHKSQMRRGLSILLILFFSFGPLSAMLGASEDARLPTCCRRLGAHHCVLSQRMASMMAESGQASLTTPATCPVFPDSAAANTSATQALAASPAHLPALLAQLHSAASDQSAARVGQIRTRTGRGPPSSSLA
jgi:hypothetical protein